MAGETIIMDSGPLILLAKIDALPILERLHIRYIAPTTVQNELSAGPLYGHPPVEAPWLTFVPLASPVSEYLKATLDDGEAAAIQLALEQNIENICLDDRRGRNMAKALGLSVVGLLGLLVRAKRQGVIAEVKPYTTQLLSVGARYSSSLIQKVLAGAGE